jgi:RNA polymerase sigma-70 factor (ECF subfamily)
MVSVRTHAPELAVMQRDLVERAREGDADAFAELAGTAADRLYAIASRILRDGDRAADATQQALIAMWNGLPGLRDPDRFDAWACRLVVHASYREARREGRMAARVREIRVPTVVEDEVHEVDDRDEVDRAFRRLSPEHRAVLVLHYYAGLPVTRIADVLGIADGTAAARLQHATRQLRAAVEADARTESAWRTTA